MAIVYQHRRKDTNKVFYIGIGAKRSRAYELKSRNKFWKSVVNKAGFEVDILLDGISWEDACEVERGMISDYGRKDLGTGELVNLTEGGDGILGLSIQARSRIAEGASKYWKGRKKGPLSEQHKQKLREVRMGKAPWNKGTKGLMKPNRTTFKAGQIAWNKDISHTQAHKDNLKKAWISRKHKK